MNQCDELNFKLKIYFYNFHEQDNCRRRGDAENRSETGMEERNKDHIRRKGRWKTRLPPGRHNLFDRREKAPVVQSRRGRLRIRSWDPFGECTNWLFNPSSSFGRWQNESLLWYHHISWLSKGYYGPRNADPDPTVSKRRPSHPIPRQVSVRVERGTKGRSCYHFARLFLNFP